MVRTRAGRPGEPAASPAPGDSHAPGQIDREIDSRGILVFGLSILGVTLVAALIMWFLYQRLLAAEVAKDPPPSPIVERGASRLPPEPRLQTNPDRELAAMHRAEAELLEGYAWVDREAGRVRIPIERAREWIAAQGLPETDTEAVP